MLYFDDFFEMLSLLAIFVYKNMRIHYMQIRCDGILYDVQKINDDTINIIGLFEAIEEDLKSLKKDLRTTLDVTARIRG